MNDQSGQRYRLTRPVPGGTCTLTFRTEFVEHARVLVRPLDDLYHQVHRVDDAHEGPGWRPVMIDPETLFVTAWWWVDPELAACSPFVQLD